MAPQTLLFDTSGFSGIAQHEPAQVQHSMAYSAPHASTSQIRVEDLLTQATDHSAYGVAFIPIHAGEGTSSTSQRNNVISVHFLFADFEVIQTLMT
jgi:hypothetical protein